VSPGGRRIPALAASALLAGCSLPEGLVAGFFEPPPLPPQPKAESCERCHQEVFREWRDSLHARAWESESFQRASAGGRAAECAGCHAAAPIAADRPVLPRQAHREEGVTCITCHQAPDAPTGPFTMRGPVSRTSPIEVHPVIEEDPLYRSSELCGLCHGAALSEWRAAPDPEEGEKPTCQACHMPKVQRKVESVHDEHRYSAVFVALGETQELRRHLFAVPDDADRSIEVRVEPEGSPDAPPGRLRVTVRNGLPHALPTGAYGRRLVRVVARWPGGEVARELVRNFGEAIPAGGERSLVLDLGESDPAPRSVEVALERWDHGSGGWQTLVRSVPEAPSSSALHEAERQTAFRRERRP